MWKADRGVENEGFDLGVLCVYFSYIKFYLFSASPMYASSFYTSLGINQKHTENNLLVQLWTTPTSTKRISVLRLTH